MDHRTWTRAAARVTGVVLAAPGILLAPLTSSFAVLLWLAVLAAGVAAVVAAAAAMLRRGSLERGLAGPAAVGAVVGLALVGWTGVAGTVGGLLALAGAALVLLPGCGTATRRRPTPARRGRRRASRDGFDPDLSTPELVLMWRVSYTQLENARSHRARCRVVARRQACLDELERRDPTGFRRWLAAGPRAAGDPSRYLRA